MTGAPLICYRDRTYCLSDDHLPGCQRQLTAQVEEAAAHWWTRLGGTGAAPVAWSLDLCHHLAAKAAEEAKGG